ncbi:MAG: hypothetical protein NVSMB32_03860 [Actinomycetota bacterium]
MAEHPPAPHPTRDPSPAKKMGRGKRRLLIAGGVVVVLLAAGAISLFVFIRRNVPTSYADIGQQFKYGSIGAEARSGVPYWIWVVLPKVFPDYLPNHPGTGYEKIGFITEAGQPRPIGTSYREAPIGMIGLNCAVCHVSTFKPTPGASAQIVLGQGANQFDLQGYLTLLRKAGQDRRFNADTLLAAIHKEDPQFSWIESLAYRYFVIPRTKAALVKLNSDFRWMDSHPVLGPGRVDTFNPYKVLLGFDMSNDHSIGSVHLPAIWNQQDRVGMSLHWDGNNSSLSERNKSAAIGAGATPDSLDLASMKRIEDWILTLKPPAFPADKVTATMAAAGATVWQVNCASCHALGGAQVGKVTPISSIATDPQRLDSFTAQLSAKMDTIAAGKPFAFSHFVKTNGYANSPLDGVWLRGPFLHNGSVPTLRALLSPPDQRPSTFYVGYDVYDFQNLGYLSTGTQAQAQGFLFDTKLPGNGNQGHTYGTALSPPDVDALLEYLKTL